MPIFSNSESIFPMANNVDSSVCKANSLVFEYANISMLFRYSYSKLPTLSSNPSKTEYMIIGHPMKARGTNAPTGLELGSKEIKRVSNTKSLGGG